MTTTTDCYSVRELLPTDEPAVLALLSTSLAGGPTGERTADFLRWKHRDNPFGVSPGLVAVTEDGALAAVRLLLRWELRSGARVLRAVRAVDTATHPDHQGRGLFRRLTTAALDTVAADAELVFNTPNAQSRPGYLRMGWQVVGDVPVALRPIRPLRLLRGLRGAGQAPVLGPDLPVRSRLPRATDVLQDRAFEVAELLAEAERGAATSRLRTHRSPAYLHWRYACPPGLDYRAVVVQSGGRLHGLGLGRLRRRGTLAEFTLGEVLVRPGDRGAAGSVLRAAARSGADHVAAHLSPGSGLAAAGRRAGYLPVPGRGLTLTVNPRAPLPVDAAALTNWALQLGDLELF